MFSTGKSCIPKLAALRAAITMRFDTADDEVWGIGSVIIPARAAVLVAVQYITLLFLLILMACLK
jgi:hypothetical protein